MQPGLEIWIINKHAHEAVPLREGMPIPPPGEPFVPKAQYDAVCLERDEALAQLRDCAETLTVCAAREGEGGGMTIANTTLDSPVYERNEDATKAANLCARQLVDFLDGLMAAQDDHERAAVIERAREHHANVFDAFIYGVDWGRANPREERTLNDDIARLTRERDEYAALQTTMNKQARETLDENLMLRAQRDELATKLTIAEAKLREANENTHEARAEVARLRGKE